VHPDGTGALKKRQAVDWKVTRRVDDKNPSAGPRCWYGNSFSTVPWQLSCCAGRRSLVERHRLPFSWLPNDYGSSRWRKHDSTAGCRLDLLCCVVPPKSNGLDPWEYDKELYKREMKWNDCSAGGRDLAGSSLASTSSILCFLLSCSLCLLSIPLDSVNKP